MVEQKMLLGSKQDSNPEKYGKLMLVRLYQWSVELRPNQNLSETDTSYQKNMDRRYKNVMNPYFPDAFPVLACDLRYTLEKQGCSANLCQADRGTQWVNAKTRICGSVLTAA
mgnify:CR=1 FL=1